MAINITYSLRFFFSFLSFFSWSVTSYLLPHSGTGVCLSRRVCCVSPIEESCRLRVWAWVSECVERENVCVCLCVLHCSDWASWGCFKQAALPMWPAQPQAGIRYWDTHTLSLSPLLSLSLSLSLALSPSLSHRNKVSTVHPLATAQGSGGISPHTHRHTRTLAKFGV